MNFKDDIPSILIDSFKNHLLLLFVSTSMQDANENCHYAELVEEPLRLEKNFTIPLAHVTELVVLMERISSVAVDMFEVVGKKSKMDIVSFQQIIDRIRLLKYRYLGSNASDYVPIFSNKTFASKKGNPAICRVSIEE